MTKMFRLQLPKTKSLPRVLRVLLNPMVFVAIGLHALLLFYPLSGEQKPKPKAADKKEEPIKLTQLSKAPPPKLPKRNLPKVNSDRPKPPALNAPPKPPGADGGSNTQDPLKDFPHYPNAQINCYGKTGDTCRFTNDAFSAIVAHFEKALPAAKFKFEVDTDNQGEKIYKVTKESLSFYVSVLNDAPQTVYFVMGNKVTKAQLEKIKTGPTAVIPPQLDELLNAVAPPTGGSETLDATPTDLGANADAFFQSDPTSPLNQVTVAGIHGTRIAQGDEASIVAIARKTFDSVNPAGTYGGGNLYEIKKGGFTGYLSVVAGPSTVVAVWLQRPQ